MSKRYPHLAGNESGFPDVKGVDVFKYDNGFDYDRYDAPQMQVQVCSVPWDVGEVHVGDRMIEGLGNVVAFGSKAERDAWLADIPDTECFRWETNYKELHKDLTIDVPIPFDVAAGYNYVAVRYKPFAAEDSLVEYESGASGFKEWFYFVRDIEFVAPNTTRLTLLEDAWQTYIYDFDITSMLLERGHAPMLDTTVEDYLTYPCNNNESLLADDVNFGDLAIAKGAGSCVLNSGDMWAVFAVTSEASGTWGAKYDDGWNTPANLSLSQDGYSVSYFIFTIEPSELYTFLNECDYEYPQFKQTVKGVFFVSKKLLQVTSDFSLFGFTVHHVAAVRKSLNLLSLDMSMFGYPSRYRYIPKLYTYPYAAIVVTDDKGSQTLVKVEDTTGVLALSAMANMLYPYINISGYLEGLGGALSTQLTFNSVYEHSLNVSGRWYETLRTWDVPMFSVVQSNARYYDFDTHWVREQELNDANTAHDNASNDASVIRSNSVDMANTVRDTTKNMADAIKSNEYNTANTMVKNAGTQTTANDNIREYSNTSAEQDTYLTNQLGIALQAWSAGYTYDTVNAENTAEAGTAAVSAGASVASGIVQGLTGGMSASNPIAGTAATVNGVAQGCISAGATIAQTAIAINLAKTKADLAVGYSQNQLTENNTNNDDKTTNQTSTQKKITDASNKAITTTNADSASAIKENAKNINNAQYDNADALRDTTVDNADLTQLGAKKIYDRNLSNAKARIDNQVYQAALGAPHVFGETVNASTAATMPQGLFATVVTENDAAIKAAGDEFLRFGYAYDQRYEFDGDWVPTKKFCYWKCRDFWVSGLSIPDAQADYIRYLLLGGVTVWKHPEDIGNTTIYDNGW